MGNSLVNKHIVIGASRKTEEMTRLIEKQGGKASIYSLQGTIFKAEKEIESKLRDLILNGSDWMIFTTGIGLEALIEQADKLQLKNEFIKQVKKANIASRGYKTHNALKKLEVEPVICDDDGTTSGLIRQLEDINFNNKRVIIQLHGEKAPNLIKFLEHKGADIMQLLPYQHIPPERETVERLCVELLAETVDAVCFTTAIQVNSLFNYAKEKGYFDKITTIFNSRTVATAVGKVTAEALKELNIDRIVVPKHERMGSMVIELAKYFDTCNVG